MAHWPAPPRFESRLRQHAPRRVCLWLSLFYFLLFTSILPTPAAEQEFPEYELKSAFMYNFAKFVTWPEKAFPSGDSPIIIGIIGKDPFGALLEETIREKKVHGRPLSIRHFGATESPTNCHMLFIGRAEQEQIPRILEDVRGRPLLTIGEVERFAHNGGMINFVIVAGSVRFEINLAAAEKAGLQVSSKLAGVGTLVRPDRKGAE